MVSKATCTAVRASISTPVWPWVSTVALQLMQQVPERLARVALIATGDGLIGHAPHTFAELLPNLAAVLQRTEYPRDLPKHLAAYWNFVAATGGDALALTALAQAIPALRKPTPL